MGQPRSGIGRILAFCVDAGAVDAGEPLLGLHLLTAERSEQRFRVTADGSGRWPCSFYRIRPGISQRAENCDRLSNDRYHHPPCGSIFVDVDDEKISPAPYRTGPRRRPTLTPAQGFEGPNVCVDVDDGVAQLPYVLRRFGVDTAFGNEHAHVTRVVGGTTANRKSEERSRNLR